MIFTTFALFARVFADLAYFPNVCPLMEEDLHLCVGEKIEVKVQITDFENPDLICDQNSEPEKCFVISNSTEISISDDGVLTYMGTNAGRFEYRLIVFDEGRETFTYEKFDYYNFARVYDLVFEVEDSVGEFYLMGFDECGKCPECASCIEMECGMPYVGKFYTPIPERLEYKLLFSQDINITVEPSGVFSLTPPCHSSSDSIQFSIQVFDKSSNCTSTSTFSSNPSFFPNFPPSIKTNSTSFSTYHSSAFTSTFQVSDPNHLPSELTTATSDTRFSITQLSDNIYSVHCLQDLDAGTYNFEISATDSGIQGHNIKTSQIGLSLRVKSPDEFPKLLFPKLTVAKYSGSMFYLFDGFDLDKFYLQVNTFDSGILVVDQDRLALFWDWEVILLYEHESVVRVEVVLFEKDCGCTLKDSEFWILIEVVDPPVLRPQAPLVVPSGCALQFGIDLRFKYLDRVEFGFEGFEGLLSPEVRDGRFYWEAPEVTERLQKKFFVIASFTDHCFNKAVSKMEFWVTVFPDKIILKDIPDYLKVVEKDQDYELNLIDYIIYYNLTLISFIPQDSDFDFSLDSSTIFIPSSDLQSFINNETYKLGFINIQVSSDCNSTVQIQIDLLVLNSTPSIFINSELWCISKEPCTIDLTQFISPAIHEISSYSFKSLPNEIISSPSQLFWIPSENFTSSGFITYNLTILRVSLSTEFVIYVYRRPIILTFSYNFYSAIVGEYWEYEVQAFSFEGFSVTCTNKDKVLIDSGPSFLGSILAWNLVTNLNQGEILNEYNGEVICFYNESVYVESVLQYSIKLYSRCQILNTGSFLPAFGKEWVENISVYDPDGFNVSLRTGKNSPLTLAIDKVNSSDGYSWFSLKWFPDLTGTYEFELICIKQYQDFSVYPPLAQIEGSENMTLVIGEEFNVSNIELCDFKVFTSNDWICLISALNLQDCSIEVEDIIDIKASVKQGKCIIKWLQSGINLNGVKETSMIRLNLFNKFSTAEHIYFTLYPNDIPKVISQSEYDLVIGLVPFTHQLEVIDSNDLKYELIRSPSDMKISDKGLITWTSPETMQVPSITLIELKITDSHEFPVSVYWNISIYHYQVLEPPRPLCPGLIQLEVGFEWVWDTRQDSNVYNYSIKYQGIDLRFDDGVIYYTPLNAQQTEDIFVTHSNYLNASTSCSFVLYPNYRPTVGDFDLIVYENERKFYRLEINDSNNYLDDLVIEVVEGPDWLSLADEYGLVFAYLEDFKYADNPHVLNFTLRVTDNHLVPMSVEKNIKLIVYGEDDKPYFLGPLDQKQFLRSGLVEGQTFSLEFGVYDEDTDFDDLEIKFSYNPYGVEVSLIEEWRLLLRFTPGNLVETSGLCTLVLSQKDNLENYDSVDILFYNIEQIDDAPVFLNDFPDVVVFENEKLEIILDVDDIDSQPKDIWVYLKNSEGLSLVIIGIDAIIREPYPVSQDLSSKIEICVCSSPSSCSCESFTLTIKHINDPPIFTQAQSESFIYYSRTQNSKIDLIGEDPEGDSVIFCIIEGDDVYIDGNRIVWSQIESDQIYTEFTVAVTDELDCSNLQSFSQKKLFFVNALIAVIYQQVLVTHSTGLIYVCLRSMT